MDISCYIQDLLWEYECVIIPGFGGILASYRSAEMVLAEHTLYPPSKTLAFNEYLVQNDGLLINYISRTANIDYNQASDEVDAWVIKTKKLLAGNEEIYLPSIGRFYRDVERHLQFTPDSSANYLYSSYGLRKVVAAPVLKDKSEGTIEVLDAHRPSYTLQRNNRSYAMAAMVILFLGLAGVLGMMYEGVNIKPLNLNTASVLSMLENVSKTTEAMPEPKVSISNEVPKLVTSDDAQPVIINSVTTVDSTTDHNSAPVKVRMETTNTGVTSPTGRKYYVIIGSFHDPKNLHHAEDFLRNHHPSEQPFEDTTPDWVRIGFYAGDSYKDAFQKLQDARHDDKEYWLLVRQ